MQAQFLYFILFFLIGVSSKSERGVGPPGLSAIKKKEKPLAGPLICQRWYGVRQRGGKKEETWGNFL